MADHAAKTGVNLSNFAYDALRRLVEVVFPAAAALYTGLAALWGWGNVAEVVGTITTVTVFCAAILGLSRRVYDSDGQYDGEVILDESNPDEPVIRLQPYPGALQGAVSKDKITFKGLPPA